MLAVGYIRVSTNEQAKDGVSLDNQLSKIRAYAELNGFNLAEIVNDPGKSGKTLDREGVQKIITMCQNKEIAHVIVYKLDRLTRSTKDMLFLVEDIFRKYDIQFHSLNEKIDTSTAQGKFFLTIMGAMSQMERDLISERTKDALQYKKSQGHRLGSPSLGIKIINGTAETVNEELSVLARIAQLRRTGLAMGRIATALNIEGYRTKRNCRWHSSTVSYLLKYIIPNFQVA